MPISFKTLVRGGLVSGNTVVLKPVLRPDQYWRKTFAVFWIFVVLVCSWSYYVFYLFKMASVGVVSDAKTQGKILNASSFESAFSFFDERNREYGMLSARRPILRDPSEPF